MSLAYTAPFIHYGLDALNEAIREQGLAEDLGVRLAPEAGHVILYALEGASSWPYEHLVGNEFELFDIEAFLDTVAQPGQEIEVHENGECWTVSILDG